MRDRASHIVAIVSMLSLLPARLQAHDRALADLSLEELFEVQVVSASKKPERRSRVAAALSVITSDDIRRSGARNLPEALRLAPEVHVARIDSSKWVVSIRGFSNRLSNKLLVLIDGRTVYTPLYAGVFWDVQDTLIEDIDRIEVVRGPGGALWGANAVNGVINVITKSAAQTQGALAYAGGGTEERAFAGLRYGGRLGDRLHYRIYGKYSNRDGGYAGDDDCDVIACEVDDWWLAQGGFRADWDATARDDVTIQGDAYGGQSAPIGTAAEGAEDEVRGANLLGRWRHRFSATSESALQSYYDVTDREDPLFTERRHTLDLDFQHRFRLVSWQEVVWGAGYRLTGDSFDGSPEVTLSQDHRNLQLFSAFLQDEFAFLDDSLRLILGTKVEHNDFTGFEWQPNGRVAWTPTEHQTAWAAVSRAVRVPSRVENDIIIESMADGITTRFQGSLGTRVEKLLSYEAGYRLYPVDWAFADFAAFYSDYDDLLSAEAGAPIVEPDPPPGRTVVPFVLRNGLDGHFWGGGLAATAEIRPWWQLRVQYAYLKLSIHGPQGALDPQDTDDASPQNQAMLWSSFDLPWQLEADGIFRYVDSLPGEDVGSYFNLDVRLGWRISDRFSVSLVGHDLLEDHHREFSGGTQVQRGVWARLETRL